MGADFRLKCMGCGHQIMIARKLVEKNTKDFLAAGVVGVGVGGIGPA